MGRKIRKHRKPEWMIHYVANGAPCECCGKIKYPYIDNICDAHTFGLTRLYGHPELRIVLDFGAEDLCTLLNHLGEMVRDGRRFSPGDKVSGLFTDCDVRIDDIDDGDETERALRVVIPDGENRFPDEDGCDRIYALQALPLKELKRK